MTSVNLSNISITKAKFRYSMSELVDDFLRKKLSKEVREYAKKHNMATATVPESMEI